MSLRLMCSSLETRVGFNIDEVEDVKIALTEAVSLCLKASIENDLNVAIELSNQCFVVNLSIEKDEIKNDEIEIEAEVCKHLIDATTTFYEITEKDNFLHIAFTKDKEE